MNKIVFIILLVASMLLCIYLLLNLQNEKVIYLTDTLKITDSVFVKYERVNPKRIYICKTDTIKIIKESLTGLEKKNDKITMTLQDEKDSTNNKYEFENIYRDFILYSDSTGIKLYRKNFGWDGMKLKTGFNSMNFKDSIKSKLYVGIETGIYYKRLHINTGLNYYPFIRKCGIDINVAFLIP